MKSTSLESSRVVAGKFTESMNKPNPIPSQPNYCFKHTYLNISKKKSKLRPFIDNHTGYIKSHNLNTFLIMTLLINLNNLSSLHVHVQKYFKNLITITNTRQSPCKYRRPKTTAADNPMVRDGNP